MRRTAMLGASLLACCAAAFPALAQSSLDELERRFETLPDPAGLPREPGYLGLVADDALPGGGIRVTAVYEASPAAAAGIQPGDLIVSIGGVGIRNLDEMGRVLSSFSAGVTTDVELRRGVRKSTTRVTLGRKPGSAAAPRAIDARPSLGVQVVPLTAEARARYGLVVATGALVMSVQPGSAADEAGLLPGAAIVALDGRRIDDPAELAFNVASMRVGQEVEVAYYVGDVMYRKQARLTAPLDDAAVADRREAAKPAAGSASEELAQLKRDAADLQSQLESLNRRISELEARIPAEEKK